VWAELQKKSFRGNPELQKKFLTASHEGMNAAQKKIIEFIQSDEPLTDSHQVLFTGIADGMAANRPTTLSCPPFLQRTSPGKLEGI
jgi:hypothetical protein